MMFIFRLLYLSLAVWTLPNSGIYAKQYYDDLEYDRVDIRLVEPSGRVERSQELPYKMTFHLLSEKTNVHVRLKRAPKINIPTYVSSGGKIQQTYIADYQTSGVYVNVQMGNVMMVTDRGGYYDLSSKPEQTSSQGAIRYGGFVL
ncbi:hypothetical protein LOTGIDRAFT_162053 [Lottia gigantea]|uniref:Peptidase M12B propeptide domain-containing protein n=1 Tax=Lottia gigantea TaxID=225164 RepID=V4AD49_LOTGI|nr:hypothetical protein LOTGIDRAFT_162053 [Lottia gigantea]ESO93030.1 hypothetical protein LOTGIDRAFT_162053 [Lottia gigantea]